MGVRGGGGAGAGGRGRGRGGDRGGPGGGGLGGREVGADTEQCILEYCIEPSPLFSGVFDNFKFCLQKSLVSQDTLFTQPTWTRITLTTWQVGTSGSPPCPAVRRTRWLGRPSPVFPA